MSSTRRAAIVCAALVVATPAYCGGQCPEQDDYCGRFETGLIYEQIQDDSVRFCKFEGTLLEQAITEGPRNRAAMMGF